MEVHRANVKDIVRGVMGVGITVTSKQQQRIVPLIPELVDLLDRYLLSRKKGRVQYCWDYAAIYQPLLPSPQFKGKRARFSALAAGGEKDRRWLSQCPRSQTW